MAKQYSEIDDALRAYILKQRLFFTASATSASRVNVSPRSTDCFRILDRNAVVYLDRTGSGNETAAHLKADGRLTIMFCSFEGPPRILRLYGRGAVMSRASAKYRSLLSEYFGNDEPLGTRQIVTLAVDLVQTSCGFGVPLFDYKGERDALDRWAQSKGPEGLDAYRREKNSKSIDGLPTGLFDEA